MFKKNRVYNKIEEFLLERKRAIEILGVLLCILVSLVVMLARSGTNIGRKTHISLKRANFGTYKTSTGLVGLAVDPHGRENLIAVADEIMSSISRVPAGNQYRINVRSGFRT